MQGKESINRSESAAARSRRAACAHAPGHRSDPPRPARADRGGCLRGACQAGRGLDVAGDEATAADPYWKEDEAAHAGEMRVNTGGDPGRDDYGLPPVDIEVPDDARELGRDVQAYYRELRSLRRRILARKLYGPLARDGMVLPLLAGCLALTLLAATLLTVFTVGQGTVGAPFTHPDFARSGAASPAAGGSGTS